MSLFGFTNDVNNKSNFTTISKKSFQSTQTKFKIKIDWCIDRSYRDYCQWWNIKWLWVLRIRIMRLQVIRSVNQWYLNFKIIFSKMTFAVLSQATALSKRVFHQTQNTFNRIQNTFITDEIHDQGKTFYFRARPLASRFFVRCWTLDVFIWTSSVSRFQRYESFQI